MRKFLMTLLIVCSAATAHSQENARERGWTTYSNQRFGLELRYPSALFSARRSSVAGDGDLFMTPDKRARLLVGAFENTDHHSPASYQKYIARQSYSGLRVDYAPVGQSWSVLSGTLGDTMIYEKVMFSCAGRVINSFAVVYPIAERRTFDPIVESIEDSFRPDSQGCSQHASTF